MLKKTLSTLTALALFMGVSASVLADTPTVGTLVINQNGANGTIGLSGAGSTGTVGGNNYTETTAAPGTYVITVTVPEGFALDSVKDGANATLTSPYTQVLAAGATITFNVNYVASSATPPATTPSEDRKTPKVPKTLTAEVVACMQAAVESRDTALVTAVDKYATSAKLALTTRKDALKSAWSLPSAKEIRAALKTAWANYKKALTVARKAMKADKKTSWDKFKTDRRACKAPNEVDNSSQGADSQL